jgi:hypothetical protein
MQIFCWEQNPAAKQTTYMPMYNLYAKYNSVYHLQILVQELNSEMFWNILPLLA